MLIPAYAIREAATEKYGSPDEEDEKTKTMIDSYTESFRPSPELPEAKLRAVPEMIERGRDNVVILSYASRNDPFYKFLIYATIFLMALYLLSPVDLLPELQFGILGIVDDVAILLLGLWLLDSIAIRFVNNLRMRQRRE